jgi:hypothetical protein
MTDDQIFILIIVAVVALFLLYLAAGLVPVLLDQLAVAAIAKGDAGATGVLQALGTAVVAVGEIGGVVGLELALEFSTKGQLRGNHHVTVFGVFTIWWFRAVNCRIKAF